MITVKNVILSTLIFHLISPFMTQALFSQSIKQNGICFVTWGEGDYATPDADWSLEQLAETGANWIRLRVQWIQDTVSDTLIYRKPDGPADDDLIHVIHKAHELGLKVMLAPNVDLEKDPDYWPDDPKNLIPMIGYFFQLPF